MRRCLRLTRDGGYAPTHRILLMATCFENRDAEVLAPHIAGFAEAVEHRQDIVAPQHQPRSFLIVVDDIAQDAAGAVTRFVGAFVEAFEQHLNHPWRARNVEAVVAVVEGYGHERIQGRISSRSGTIVDGCAKRKIVRELFTAEPRLRKQSELAKLNADKGTPRARCPFKHVLALKSYSCVSRVVDEHRRGIGT